MKKSLKKLTLVLSITFGLQAIAADKMTEASKNEVAPTCEIAALKTAYSLNQVAGEVYDNQADANGTVSMDPTETWSAELKESQVLPSDDGVKKTQEKYLVNNTSESNGVIDSYSVTMVNFTKRVEEGNYDKAFCEILEIKINK